MRVNRLWPIPKEMKAYGAEFYKRIGKQLVVHGVLTELDKESFVSLCRLYQVEMLASNEIDRFGVNVVGSKGVGMVKNPAVTTYKSALDMRIKLARKFFLTPGDRKGIDLKKPVKANGKEKYFA